MLVKAPEHQTKNKQTTKQKLNLHEVEAAPFDGKR